MNTKYYLSRFAKLTATLQEVLKEENVEFMHNDHLGWILTCPSNLGTGLRAGSMVKVPLFSARKDFKEVCKKMGLQARGTKGLHKIKLFNIKNFNKASIRLQPEELGIFLMLIDLENPKFSW